MRKDKCTPSQMKACMASQPVIFCPDPADPGASNVHRLHKLYLHVTAMRHSSESEFNIFVHTHPYLMPSINC